MVHDQVQEEHQHQDAAEGDHNGGTSGCVELHTEVTAERRNQRAHGPADCQTPADAVGKEHGANAGNDQVAEHQQHAGDGHRRGHHKAERSVEEEVPEAHVEALLFGFVMVHGNGQKFLAKDKVEDADGAVEKSRLANFGPGDRQDVAYEHVLEVLGLAGGFAHEKNGGGGSDGISDADESFLGNVASARASESEYSGAKEREREADPVGSAAVRVHADDDGDRGAERGDLCESKIHKNDAALDHVHAQIGVDPREDETRDKRCEQKR